MNERELKQLWRSIAGNGRRLLIPKSAADVPETNIRFLVTNTLSQLADGDSDPGSLLFSLLSSSDTTSLLTLLANINARLLSSGNELDLHDKLEADLLTAEQRMALAKLRSGTTRRPDRYIVFHRRALLLLMKVALGVARSGQVAALVDSIAGDLVLAANDVTERLHRVEGDAALMMESLVTWDLENGHHWEIFQQISRFEFLFEDMYSDDAQIAYLRTKFPLPEPPFDGLTFTEHRALLFAMSALTERAISEGKAAIIEMDQPIPQSVGPSANVRSAIELRSIVVEDFSDKVFGSGWGEEELRQVLADARFANDHTWLRQQPFVKLETNRYLVLDRALAVTRTTSGLFWTLLDSLPIGKIREDFFSFWGVLFERYIVKMFRYYYPNRQPLADLLFTDLPYEGKATSGQVDALLDFGDHVLLFEVKSSPLPVDQRTRQDLEVLEEWIESRLVKPPMGKKSEGKRALLQLASDGAEAVAKGYIAVSNPNAIIYPILLTDEIAFECLGFNRHLSKKFEQVLPDALKSRVRPLTVVSTREFEEALPNITAGLISWKDSLESRFSGRELTWFCFSQSIDTDIAKAGHQDQKRVNDMLRARYDRFLSEFTSSLSKEIDTPGP